jgi:hypothetical protein
MVQYIGCTYSRYKRSWIWYITLSVSITLWLLLVASSELVVIVHVAVTLYSSLSWRREMMSYSDRHLVRRVTRVARKFT